ncbi:hypothetical protein RR47_GL001423 [Enterococcus columbae DSM 7374 = ATCC 51263]|nr:hypothetical protein RR47_GL001423 [Enterococcus columbae DSM 7374 = ATCC 51263]
MDLANVSPNVMPFLTAFDSTAVGSYFSFKLREVFILNIP